MNTKKVTKKALISVSVALVLAMALITIVFHLKVGAYYSGGERVENYPGNSDYKNNYSSLSLEKVTVHGDYVFGMQFIAHEIFVIDVSDKEHTQISSTIGGEMSDIFYSIYVENDWLYIGGSREFLVVNVEDKEKPEIVGDCYINGTVHGLAVSGDYAYLATGYGLSIVALHNKERPEVVSRNITEGMALDVLVRGDYVYLADGGNGLIIFDVSDRENPRRTGHYLPEDSDVMDIDMKKDVLYFTGDRLVALDVRNKENPEKVWEYGGDTRFQFDSGLREHEFRFWTLAVHKDRLYAADSSFYMIIFDIENEQHPREIGYFPSYYGGHFQAKFGVEGDYLYALEIYILTTEGNPDFWKPVVLGWLMTGMAEGLIILSSLIQRDRRKRSEKSRKNNNENGSSPDG